MTIPSTISAFLYIAILLIGMSTATIYTVKALTEDQELYKVGGIFTGMFLMYAAFEFLLTYFSKNADTYGLFRLCVAVSDCFYFLMVVSWLVLVGFLSGNPFLVKKRLLFIVTAVYAVVVELLVAIEWRISDGQLALPAGSVDPIRIIMILNFTYSVILAVCGIRYLLFGIGRMSGERSQKYVIAFSLTFIIYIGWIIYWDFIVASEDFATGTSILKFDPILFAYPVCCLISLGMLFKKDALRLERYRGSDPDPAVETERAWEIIAETYRLTIREIEIMRLVYEGRSNPDIGRTLFIAENTVKRHMNHIFSKTGAKNRYELLSFITKLLK